MTDVPLIRRPPDIEALLDALVSADIQFVITGSVAAQAQGVKLEPGDLDVVPSLEPANLAKLVAVLLAIEARPQGFGSWSTDASGERKWIATEVTPELRAGWKPDVSDLTSLDHLYFTRHGDLDVVPELTGRYDDLKARAVVITVHGHEVLVAGIEDVLGGMTKDGKPRRKKDERRVAQLKTLMNER